MDTPTSILVSLAHFMRPTVSSELDTLNTESLVPIEVSLNVRVHGHAPLRAGKGGQEGGHVVGPRMCDRRPARVEGRRMGGRGPRCVVRQGHGWVVGGTRGVGRRWEQECTIPAGG